MMQKLRLTRVRRKIVRVKCGKNGMFSFPNNESESQLKAYLNGNLGIVR